MNLSTYFLPYPISSFYLTSYAVEAVEDYTVKDYSTALQVREMDNIANIVEEGRQKIESLGYENVVAEWNKQEIDENELLFIGVQNNEQSKQSIYGLYNYYADYVEVSKGDNSYYFKNKEDSEEFINNVNQYLATSYEVQENVKKEIGSETEEDELAEVVEQAKQTAAALKRRKTSYTIIDTSNISNASIVQYAIQFVGNPYRWGGTSLINGTDCSGFTQSVYAHFGVSLPRTAGAQASVGTPVSFNNLQPGDLLFYSNGRGSIAHVAMYIGGSKIVHAGTPATGINICTANIMTKVCARRIF